jgi:hypothetical protein
MTINPALWIVMRAAAGDEDALRNLAEQANEEQLIHLHRQFLGAVGDLAGSNTFSAKAGRRNTRLAAWIVSQGRATYRDAERGMFKFPAEAPSNPNFARVMRDVYLARFGHEIPEFEPDPSNDSAIVYDPVWDAKMWELIDVLRAGVPFRDAAARYTRRDLLQLSISVQEVRERIVERAAARFGESEDDDWLKWADWMLGHGQEAVETALARPDTRSDVPDDAEDQMFDTLLSSEYAARYGVVIPLVASRR